VYLFKLDFPKQTVRFTALSPTPRDSTETWQLYAPERENVQYQ